MKKLFALLLALVLVLSAVGLADESTWLTDEKITLDVFLQTPGSVVDYNENEFTRYLEELTNVHLNWVEVDFGGSDDDNVTKLNIMLASGDYPDILLQNSFKKNTLYQAGLDGVLIPLNDLIEEYAPNLSAIFAQRPDIKAQWTAPDGNIYGLGYITEYFHGEANNRVWVYEPWLEQLGIEAPQTVDEYYDFLVAVKNNDLNGNGIADEIPLLTMDTSTKVWLISQWIFFDGSNLMVDGEEIKFVSDTEEYRDALRYIKRLYEEGLIPADVFTSDSTQFSATINSDEWKVGSYAAFSMNDFLDKDTDECEGHNLISLAPLEGPTGIRQIPKGRFDFSPNEFAITSACEHPEIAIAWIDWMFDEENSYRANYGPKLDGPSETEKGYYTYGDGLYYTNGISSTSPYWRPNVVWGLGFVTCFYMPITEANKTARMDGTFGWTEAKLAGSSALYDPYKVTDYVPNFFMSAEGTQEIAEYEAIIKSIVEKNFAAFVTGTKDIENDWEAYKEELNNAGLKAYLEIYQNEYDKGVLGK